MEVAAIIQARCGSTRFPNKVFADISGHPLIWHVVDRLSYAHSITHTILATTVSPLDDQLALWGKAQDVEVFRGSEADVLNRYATAAQYASADVVVRITADDPFKEPALIDAAVEKLLKERLDVVCNHIPPSYPEGLDVEVFTLESIIRADKNAHTAFQREHVTQYFYQNPTLFKIGYLHNEENLSHLRWTIDTEVDLEMVRKVYDNLYGAQEGYFTWRDIVDFLTKHPEVAAINSNVPRSAMYH